jgi:uncharacterized protein YndB with AHSA1/START domain
MTTAQQERSTFQLAIEIHTEIEAPLETVWALITDAARIVAWNSAVSSIEGSIEQGKKIAVVVPFSDRTFNLTVSMDDATHTMTWSDGFAPMFRGVRTFTLTETADGVRFDMREVFGGLMLPLIAGQLPDFRPSFEAWAKDLKAEAER